MLAVLGWNFGKVTLLMTREMSLGVQVAPHAGAWIETVSLLTELGYMYVAPHAGAWIETLQ